MITVKRKVTFRRRSNRSLALVEPGSQMPVAAGRLPRISRLMALAIHFDRLVRDGIVADLSELARLAHVTQPRMTQIMNLNHLAPAIQTALLDQPLVLRGRDPLTERDLRPLTRIADWAVQLAHWERLTASTRQA